MLSDTRQSSHDAINRVLGIWTYADMRYQNAAKKKKVPM
jgi:hypothetical protein